LNELIVNYSPTNAYRLKWKKKKNIETHKRSLEMAQADFGGGAEKIKSSVV